MSKSTRILPSGAVLSKFHSIQIGTVRGKYRGVGLGKIPYFHEICIIQCILNYLVNIIMYCINYLFEQLRGIINMYVVQSYCKFSPQPPTKFSVYISLSVYCTVAIIFRVYGLEEYWAWRHRDVVNDGLTVSVRRSTSGDRNVLRSPDRFGHLRLHQFLQSRSLNKSQKTCAAL